MPQEAAQRQTGWSGSMPPVHWPASITPSSSCGRVQTPTLAMIAHREQQIRSFKTGRLLWTAVYNFCYRWFCLHYGFYCHMDMAEKKSGSLRSFNEELITYLDKKLKNQTLTVTDAYLIQADTFPGPLWSDGITAMPISALASPQKRDIEYHAESVRTPQKVLTSFKNRLPLYRYGTLCQRSKERLKACNIGPYKKYIPNS